MTTPLRPRTAELKEIIEFALSVGAISYDGDSWYAASDGGGAGLGYERCEASFAAARQALNELVEAEAAPDLRAALERLEEWVNSYAQDYVPNDVFYQTGGFDVMEQARAALAAPAADGLDVLRPENLVAERVIASGIADVVERRGEEWFDGMRARGEYLELATRILEEISRRAPNEPSREPGEEADDIAHAVEGTDR